ncbi:MAG: class I SAM-dependent methyltransferase [Armatimonadetes bacterium]|nr:class I SAM-dependent methyltransferase [Armatimonadota bacterium]MDW8029412.1 class I SAM-dependent methyltransferase [Armatimonadota bacterium]
MVKSLSTEWSPCDLCGANDWETLFLGRDQRHYLPGEFGVTQCLKCGHLQTNPRPTQEALPSYYPDDYRLHFISKARLRRVRFRIRLMEMAKEWGYWGKGILWCCAYQVRKVLGKYWKPQGKLLDVGCGAGKIDGQLKALGWQVIGVDFSLNACSNARSQFQVATVCADGAFLPFKEESLDVIVMRHVLEHFPSPTKAIKEVHRILRKGGLVSIEVPNAASIGRFVLKNHWQSWELPRHLHHFTPANLKKLLETNGFRILRMNSTRNSLFFARLFRCLPLPQLIAKLLSGVISLPTIILLPIVAKGCWGEALHVLAVKSDVL